MHRLGLLTCVLVMGVQGVAHANQVDGTVPPPPPAVVAPPPSEEAATVPPPPPPPPAATADTMPPPNYAPAQAQAQVGGNAHWQTPAASAGQLQSAAGVEEHDGFFLRLAVGVGGARWTEADTAGAGIGGDLKVTGVSAGIDIAIGAALTDNLAIHATIFGMGVANPKVSVDGMVRGTVENASLTGTGIGIGVTYYVMPANVYLSGSVGVGDAVLTFNAGTPDEFKVETDSGYALDLIVGKEWWVSDQWGLGIAAQFMHVNVPDLDTRLIGSGFHVMFSATYN